MPDRTRPDSNADEVIDQARAAQDAVHQLCRAALARSSMTPAEVDIVLAHLSAAVAALPQTARQLGDILEQATHQQVLDVDTITATQDPDRAVETVRLHLDAIREAALDLHRHLDAAHNETHTSPSPTAPRASRPSNRRTSPRSPITPRTGSRHQWVAIVPDLAPHGDVLLPQHPLHQRPTHRSALLRQRRVPARSSVQACGQR